VLIGYARVSTNEQDLALQLDALKAAGCARSFSDTGVGIAYGAAAAQAGAGGVRLGRSLRHLIELIGELERRQIGFRSLTEGHRHHDLLRADHSLSFAASSRLCASLSRIASC